MKWSITRRTTYSLGVALATLAVLGAVSAFSLVKLRESANWVERTQEVLIQSQDLISDVKEAEIGQRGYLLTGDKRYLEPYEAVVGTLEGEIEKLRELTSDNRSQQRRLDALEPLIAARLARLERGIALRQQQGLEAAVRHIETGEGKRLMDEIRRLVREIESEENQLLLKETKQEKAIAQITHTTAGLGSALAFGLFAWASWLLNRDMQQRRQAELALRKYADIFENAQLGLAIGDKDAQTLEMVNPAFAGAHGHTVGELTGKPIADVFAPECRGELREHIRMAEEKGHHTFESKHIRKDGTVFPVQIDLTGVRDRNGKLLYRIGNVQDITQRKQAEQALKESEDRFRRAVINAPFPLIIHAEDGEVLHISSAWAELTGYTQSEIPTIADWTEKAYGERKELMRGEIERLYSLNARAEKGEYIITTKSGEKRIWNFSSAPLGKLADGRRAVITMAADVTERKRMEEELRESEEKFRQLAENIRDIFWIGSPDKSQLWYVSPACEDIWGKSCESLYANPKSFIGAIHPEDRERVIATFPKQMRGDSHLEYRIVRPDGTVRWLRDRAFPVRDGRGEIYRVAGIAEDITERVILEQALRQQAEELERANRMKDEFLAVTSHELRTPLNAILGWSKLLMSGKLDEATAARALETIERNAMLQNHLIEDLLDLSRIVRGKMRLDFSAVELHEVIVAAIDTVRTAAEAKNIHIEFAAECSPLAVWGDASRLQQVVWNLLSNAIKFTPSGGRVDIDLSVEMGNGASDTGNGAPGTGNGASGTGNGASAIEPNNQYTIQNPKSKIQNPKSPYAKIQVRDTGTGIDTDFLPHVFERFRQAESSSVRSTKGLGLGLAIVRQLVELHGGTVEAESAGRGQGATFTVKLPLGESGRGNGDSGVAREEDKPVIPILDF